jgi:hypothetical protein
MKYRRPKQGSIKGISNPLLNRQRKSEVSTQESKADLTLALDYMRLQVYKGIAPSIT